MKWHNSCSNYSTCMFPPPALLHIYNYEGESCVLWKTTIIPHVEWTRQRNLQLLRVDGLCFLAWKLQFAFQFFSLPLHCSTGWQQACARGSKLQPCPKSPISPCFEDQCLEYTMCFHHVRRGELAPLLLGDRNYFCQCCGHWRAPLPAAHSKKPGLLCLQKLSR